MTGPQEMACRVCLSMLNSHGDRYVHPVHLASDGHTPEPIPASDLDTIARSCDFCGDEFPLWTIVGADLTTIAVGGDGGGGGLIQRMGERWAACVTCETHIDTGRWKALTDRAAARLGLSSPEARERVASLHRGFLKDKQNGRTLLTTTAWPATKIHARDVPKVRDRLARFYRGPDQLPAPLAIDAREDIADGLDQAQLFWVEDDFTTLADHAAPDLPPVTIDRDLMAADNGLLVWSRPVTTGLFAAATWTRRQDGWDLVTYRGIGAGLDGTALQRLREQVGWLAPMRVIHVSDRQLLDAAYGPVGVLATTWLLIAQQIAELAPTGVDKSVRKAYARFGRPSPDVRLVRLRPRTTGPRPGPADAVGSSRPGLENRFWVAPHWRNVAYGPGKTLRRPTWILPFLKGPEDAPIKLSTTVRVLGHRSPKPPAQK